MNFKLALCGLPLLLLFSAPQVTAQVDLSSWPQVRMELLAIDSQGNPIEGLNSAAMLVNQGSRPRPIAALEPETGPQSICILIDASDAMASHLDVMLTKARRLLQRLPPQDEVCLAHYSGELSVDQKLTADRRATIGALGPIAAGGPARLRNATLQLSDYMQHSAQYRSRAIIVFSDGVDHGSKVGTEQWRHAMESEGAPVIHLLCMPIGFGHAVAKQHDYTMSPAIHLVDIGGGLVYFPHTIGEFDAMVDHLSDYLQARYVVTFAADNTARDDRERRIAVSYVPGGHAPGLMLRAPSAYVAPSR